jgi:hypothetical protein
MLCWCCCQPLVAFRARHTHTHVVAHTPLPVSRCWLYICQYICQQPATGWLWLEMFSTAQAACTCSACFASTGYRLLEPVQKIFSICCRDRRVLQIEHGSAGIAPCQTDACNRAALICSVAVSQQTVVSGIGLSILAQSRLFCCHSQCQGILWRAKITL